MNNGEIMAKFSDYLKSKGYSEVYVSPILIFSTYCSINSIDVLKVNYDHLTKFLVSLLDQKYEKSYVNNYIKAIRFFYMRFLKDYNLITDDIFESVKKLSQLKEDKKIKYSINLKKVDDLIINAIGFGFTMSPYKLKAILYFMYFTGVRFEELLELKREDIDLDKNWAFIRNTKSKRDRKVLFVPEVATALKTYFGLECEDKNAFNLTPKRINILFGFLKNFAPKLTPHSMRHSFAQHMLRSGMSLPAIQKLLGHKNIETTLLYCDPDEETIEQLYHEKIYK